MQSNHFMYSKESFMLSDSKIKKKRRTGSKARELMLEQQSVEQEKAKGDNLNKPHNKVITSHYTFNKPVIPPVSTHKHPNTTVSKILFVESLDYILAASEDSNIYVWGFDDAAVSVLENMKPQDSDSLIRKFAILLDEDSILLPQNSKATNESDSVTNRVAGFVCKYVLSEHTSCVTSLLVISREHGQDSTYVLSGGWDRRICIWDIENGRLHDVYRDPNSEFNPQNPDAGELACDGVILDMAYNPKANEFAYASSDKMVYIRKFSTDGSAMRLVNTLQGHEGDITCVVWNKVTSKWITGAEDSTIRIWSGTGMNECEQILAAQGGVCCMCVDLFNGCIVAGSQNVIRVYDCEAYRLVQTNMGHSDSVRSVIHIPERNQRDPDDKDVPYCTLKSFPANIEHCIQWARDKFESSFSQKPNLTNEFCSKHQNLADIIQRLRKGMSVDGAVQAFKVLYSRPVSWADCVHIGRLKFQKYFHNRAKQLLHAFPADTILPDGTLFWQSPKRPPTPVEFDPSNDIHMTFVISTARLYAGTAGVSYGSPDLSNEVVMPILSTVKVPEFRPSSKAIITDVAMTKADTSSSSAGGDELLDSATKLESLMNAKPPRLNQVKMCPASFEKDDDTNGHIDFITAAANLRAAMYNIEPADWFKAKKIAGRIIPAIATTTASVAGLVTIELMKVMKGCPLEDLKNCFFSLALPCMVLTEPSRAMKVTVREGMTYSLWDRWDVKGSPEFTLQQFLHHFKEKYGFAATSVVMGVKMIYIPMMPNHGKRLPQTMVKLLKPSTGQQYADLMVMFEGDGEEDVGGPPVRYFF